MELERIGKYEIVGELGRGTMGEVYKAKDPVLNRFVALKTLTARVAPGDETLQRFQREAQAAALLNHPNIVTVHDFGEEDGLLYMAMELLEGEDLRDAIDNELLKTLDEKLDVMDGILAALDYAHAKGVVHRDIKPANIHLGPGRQVKIMDFGLARVSTSEMTQEGIVLGTPNYMSPEQALGDKVDGRSDLFSTGAVLYELLTGHKPFESDSTPSVLFQVVHRQAPPVRRWVPDVPTGVVAVVNRSLEKDREKRFASAGDMRAAIAVARQALAPAVSPKAPPLPPAAPDEARAAPTPLERGAERPAGPARRRRAAGAAEAAGPDPAADAVPAGAVDVVADAAARLGPAGPALAAATAGGRGRPRRPRARRSGDRSACSCAPGPRRRPARARARRSSELTQELVRKQVRLAQRELDDKNYAAAATEAEGALKLAPGHAEASAVLASTRERVAELDQSIAQARRLLDAGDTAGASSELSHLLELDPRHPAAAELSARLNSAFRAQADAAAASMREARAAALAAGATAWSLRSVDAGVSQAELLLSKGEFADATRMFLEARDACDRSRRAALLREAATPAPGATPAVAPGRTRRDSGREAGADRCLRRLPSRHRAPRARRGSPGGRSRLRRRRHVGGDAVGRRPRGLRQLGGEQPAPAAVHGPAGVRGAAEGGAAGRAVRRPHPPAQRRPAPGQDPRRVRGRRGGRAPGAGVGDGAPARGLSAVARPRRRVLRGVERGGVLGARGGRHRGPGRADHQPFASQLNAE